MVHSDTEGTKTLPCSEIIELDKHSVLQRYGRYREGVWIIPYKWNQATVLWHAVQILPDKAIAVLHIANGAPPIITLEQLQPVIDALQPSRVEYTAIYRKFDFDKFNLQVIQRHSRCAKFAIPVECDVVWYDEELSAEDKDDLARNPKKARRS